MITLYTILLLPLLLGVQSYEKNANNESRFRKKAKKRVVKLILVMKKASEYAVRKPYTHRL